MKELSVELWPLYPRRYSHNRVFNPFSFEGRSGRIEKPENLRRLDLFKEGNRNSIAKIFLFV